MDRVVPAFVRTDGVDAADVAGRGLQRVVPALAVGAPDRMDRREVEDVETELAHVRQLRDYVVEGAVALRIAGLRAREHLVPGREARREPVGGDLEHAVVAREIAPLGVTADERRVVGREQKLELRLRTFARAGEARHERAPRRRVLFAGVRAGLLGDANALDGLEAHVEAGAALLRKLAEPSRPVVAPRLDRELVTRVALEREAAAPAIVVEERHRGPAPVEFGRRAVEHLRRDLLVTVGEDVGPDLDRLADDALHG